MNYGHEISTNQFENKIKYVLNDFRIKYEPRFVHNDLATNFLKNNSFWPPCWLCIKWQIEKPYIHLICKIMLQITSKISQMETNLRKFLNENLIGLVLNRTHVFFFENSLSFAQKTRLKLTGQNCCVFPFIWCWRSTRVRWVEFDQYKSILEPLETISMCQICL